MARLIDLLPRRKARTLERIEWNWERKVDPSVKHQAVERGVRSACRAEAVSLVEPLAELLFCFYPLFFFALIMVTLKSVGGSGENNGLS